MNTLNEIRKEASELPDDHDDKSIQSTANDLLGMKYTPTLIFETPGFHNMKKGDILSEIDRIESMDEKTEQKITHLKLLIYHYKLLIRLRNNEPEAWDEVNELYEDD